MERFTYRDEEGLTRPTKIAEQFITSSDCCRLLSKIGQYEDELEAYKKLEEEIGCPLEVRCNLDLNDRIIDMFGIEYIVRSIGKNDFIGYDVKKLEKNEFYRELFKWKEYKITWWLKADRSE